MTRTRDGTRDETRVENEATAEMTALELTGDEAWDELVRAIVEASDAPNRRREPADALKAAGRRGSLHELEQAGVASAQFSADSFDAFQVPPRSVVRLRDAASVRSGEISFDSDPAAQPPSTTRPPRAAALAPTGHQTDRHARNRSVPQPVCALSEPAGSQGPGQPARNRQQLSLPFSVEDHKRVSQEESPFALEPSAADPGVSFRVAYVFALADEHIRGRVPVLHDEKRPSLRSAVHFALAPRPRDHGFGAECLQRLLKSISRTPVRRLRCAHHELVRGLDLRLPHALRGKALDGSKGCPARVQAHGRQACHLRRRPAPRVSERTGREARYDLDSVFVPPDPKFLYVQGRACQRDRRSALGATFGPGREQVCPVALQPSAVLVTLARGDGRLAAWSKRGTPCVSAGGEHVQRYAVEDYKRGVGEFEVLPGEGDRVAARGRVYGVVYARCTSAKGRCSIANCRRPGVLEV